MLHRKPSLFRPVLITLAMSGMLLVAFAPTASAQELGDARAGRRLAETWCSTCHVIGASQSRGTSNGTPTFTGIARMPSTAPLALRAFLQTPHANMPDLHLSRDEIDDLTAYILSLRRK